ncbi:hypothetical protein [Microviridae sp.]|nr:hypothetical protein [Microviridae sp.]
MPPRIGRSAKFLRCVRDAVREKRRLEPLRDILCLRIFWTPVFFSGF